MKKGFEQFCKVCVFCAFVCFSVALISQVSIFWWICVGCIVLIPIGAYLVDDGVEDEYTPEVKESTQVVDDGKQVDEKYKVCSYKSYSFYVDTEDPLDEYNHKLKILREELKPFRDSMFSVVFDKNKTFGTEQFAKTKVIEAMNNFVADTKKRHLGDVLSEYDFFLFSLEWMYGITVDQKFADLKKEEIRMVSEIYQTKEAERERIREENKAQAEWRREQRRAEEEQKRTERELRESERLRLQAATEEERERYRLQVEELTARLQEAEGRVARAISMAQQTKCGYVYIISNEGSFGPDVCKIGLTRRLDPQERVDELGDASVPFPFTVHRFIYSDDAPALEAALHRHFADRRVNADNWRKEFFRVSPEEAMEAAAELAG